MTPSLKPIKRLDLNQIKRDAVITNNNPREEMDYAIENTVNILVDHLTLLEASKEKDHFGDAPKMVTPPASPQPAKPNWTTSCGRVYHTIDEMLAHEKVCRGVPACYSPLPEPVEVTEKELGNFIWEVEVNPGEGNVGGALGLAKAILSKYKVIKK